jgi:hypothetical protein
VIRAIRVIRGSNLGGLETANLRSDTERGRGNLFLPLVLPLCLGVSVVQTWWLIANPHPSRLRRGQRTCGNQELGDPFRFQESARRQAIVVKFLVSLGVPEPVTQRDAEGIEHRVSPETMTAFKRQFYLDSATAG